MKNIKIITVLLLGLLVFNFSSNLAKAQEKSTIRVGISNQNFSSWDYQKIKFSSQSIIKIVDLGQNSQINDIQAGKIIEITYNNSLFNIIFDNALQYQNLKGPLLLSSNTDIEILDLNRKGTPARYKGMFELRSSKKPEYFNVINVIDMENYIKGVIPNEMPVSFGKEALKAQAVAARNYATTAQISPYYDVVDSTASQVYYGSNSYTDISNQAVDETRGIYALYQNKPISALYYSTSAGISDDWDDVFNLGQKSNMHPYLKAVYETTNSPLRTEQDVIRFYSSKQGFDINSPKLRWSVTFDREELENVLHSTLVQQSNAGLVEPRYDGTKKIKGLREIKPLKRTQSGKIIELLIIADNGQYKIKKELGIRRVLKKNNSMLPSANFFVKTQGDGIVNVSDVDVQQTKAPVPIPKQTKASLFDNLFQVQEEQKPPIAPSTKETLGNVKLFSKIHTQDNTNNNHNNHNIHNIANTTSKNYCPKTFTLTGGGFGHGVGMSQFGAYNFAKNGKKYPEILHFYYTNINLSTMPRNVLYNDYNLSYKTEFYYDMQIFKKAYIIIDNKKRVSEYTYRINQYNFSPEKSIVQNELTKMDITQYLKQGMNIINFAPLNEHNKTKSLVYRIELI